MFKKALKVAVSFCLLVGAYAGYTRLFAFVTARLEESRQDVAVFPENESISARRATELARESFGADHFAASDELKLQYYEAARGLYMYAQNKKILNDGKRIHVWPFALIWESKDGKSRKVATSDEAIIDFSQPIMSAKPSAEPSKVLHARMVGDVRLRDDKGTRDDPTDDLRVGPILGAVDFDDATLRITTEADTEIFLQDRDLTLTGLGLMIQLRRKVAPPDPYGNPSTSGPSGFDAETAYVYRDVHIIVNNATSDGVLPGSAKPEKTGKTPIDVKSDREMRIDLPRPRRQDIVGPPNPNRPPDPTFVKFKTNVQVIRGTDRTDQLNCDTLDLTLMPDPRKPGEPEAETLDEGEDSAKKEEGPLTELKIRRALARGDAVWLQSEVQGMLARCVELTYEKHAFEGKPDVTYLNGGTGKKLMVEKVEFDTRAAVPGTIKSIMKLSALDATIFEFAGTSKVIARGPGNVKERPSRNASVNREVWFEDEMEMLTWHDGDDTAPTPSALAVRSLGQKRPEIPRGTLRRLLTLCGPSKLVDVETSTTLDARKSIVAEFQSEPACDLMLMSPSKGEQTIPTTGKNLVVVAAVDRRLSFRIFDRDGRIFLDTDETALRDKAPQIKDLKKELGALPTAGAPTPGEKRRIIAAVASIVGRAPDAKLPINEGEGPAQIKWLDAFEDAHLTAPSKILTARHFLKAKFEQAPPAPALAPVPIAKAAAPAVGTIPGAVAAPGPVLAPMVAAASPAPVATEPRPDADPKPLAAEPLVDGRADRVWASIQLGATGQGTSNAKGELKDAQLRGGVMVHQDPAAGEPFGSDASGEALDLTAQGKGLMKFVVKREEPQASDPRTTLASSSKRRASSIIPLTRVEFKGKTIESEDIIGVDQKLDFAWSQGAGLFTQMADRGLLDDKGIEGEKASPNARGKPGAKPSGPSPQDRLAITWTSEMRFYGKSTDLEGRPAAKIEFRGESHDVRTPDGKREFRRGVEAKMTDSAIFTDTMDVYMDRTIDFTKDDKKKAARTDEATPPDPQIAMLDCKGKDIVEDSVLKHAGVDIISQKLVPETGDLKEKYRIQGLHVIYDKRTGNFRAPGTGTTWIYRQKGGDGKSEPSTLPNLIPTSAPSNRQGRPGVIVAQKKPPTLELTKIKYASGMKGRFGVARDRAENEQRDAEFYGDVQAANATVDASNRDIDFDKLTLWPDYVFLTSDVLDVFSYPLPPGSKPANKQLLDARGNALARAQGDSIQADQITYNSASSLMYAYGEDGKEVSITKQDSTGQRPSTQRGKTVAYNNKTHQYRIDDPQAMSFADLKSGSRGRAFAPDLGGTPKPLAPKPLPRPPIPRQGRVSTERSGFTGH